MAGLGAIFGGALSGIGAGIAKQGEMDWTDRRELALQNLRAKDRQTEIIATGDQNRQTEKFSAEQTRETEIKKSELRKEEERDKFERENSRPQPKKVKTTFQDADGFYHTLFEDGTITKTAVKGPKPKPSETASQVIQAEDGTYKIVMSDGTTRGTDVKGPLKAQSGGGSSDKPLEKGGGKSSASGGAVRLSNDAAVETFIANPANRGKQFVGPDGKTYRVPSK